MIIEETFSVNAPRAEVVGFLVDVPLMSACIPGVEGLHRVDDSQYRATLLVRIGPIEARFAGNVIIDDSDLPERIVATASGRDSTTGSVAQVRFSADLTESADGSTEVRSTSDVSIRGRLGTYGTAVVTSIAREMIRSFTHCAAQAIGSVDARETQPATAPGLGSIVARGILSYLGGVWARLRSRLGRRRDQGGVT